MSTSATPGKSAYTLLYTLNRITLVLRRLYDSHCLVYFGRRRTVGSLELSTCGLPYIRTDWPDCHCRCRNFLLA